MAHHNNNYSNTCSGIFWPSLQQRPDNYPDILRRRIKNSLAKLIMTRINILFLLHSSHIQGVLKQNILLIKNLKKNKNINIRVISPNIGKGKELYKKEGIIIKKAVNEKEVIASIKKDNFIPDIVFNESVFSINGKNIAKRFNAMHIMRINEEIPENLKKRVLFKRITYKPEKNYKKTEIIFPCKHTKEYYKELVRKYKIKTKIIYNSVEERNIRKGVKKGFKILQLGTIYSLKGQIKTLRAFSIFKRKIKGKASLIFVGGRKTNKKEIDYILKLKQEIKKLNLEKFVKVRGSILNPEKYIDECNMLTLHSRSECFPTVALEAIYTGKPVIASNVGGMSEIINEKKNGYLFKNGDIKRQAKLFLEVYQKKDYWFKRSSSMHQNYLKKFSNSDSYNKIKNILNI